MLPARIALAAATALLLAAAPATGRTLRIASGFDPQTMDPHALALLYHSRVITQVYESLVHRGRDFALEPSLAVSWSNVDATTWRFRLRPDVRFHDGSAFTADDAVFSIERALAKNSQRAFQLRGVTGARKVDALTIDVLLAAPDAVLPEKMWLVAMMSRAWAHRHGVTAPQDYNGKQETHAVRNANGTGPYALRSYEPDNRLVLVGNPQWWGRRGDVTEAVYTVIQSDATRLAALASGQVDFVIDPPFQDVARLKSEGRHTIVETQDIGTQYLGFDQRRDELESSDVKGRNPFKDLRVRRAVAHAIDVDTIVAKVLRGQAAPTGSPLSRRVDGYRPDLEQRLPHDPAAARRLLAEAGYPQGFGVTLDCVNATFRAAVCQAIAGMLAQVGIRVTFQPWPTPQFFPKLTQATSSFFEFGWSPATDAWPALNAIVRSHGEGGLGAFNGGRYSNPKLDALVDGIRVEPDLARRRQMVGEALGIVHADLALLPLYRRTLAWAMRKGVEVAMWPNDMLELRFVTIR
ncbi:MAG: ABC transporter substrate-binding protein [Betaproteobacteria bacterium]|jgi:peptide/nickel transport system substrate-binding protein|nr:ABC transporter substrate-binding protein [Betaproteobacteria bacterium]